MITLSSKLLFTINSVTILVIGVVASLFFSYIQCYSQQSQKRVIQYFMVHFAIATFAFVALYIRFFGYVSFSIFSNNVLYIVAMYTLKHGLAYRDGHHKKLRQNKWLYFNIAFIIIANYFIFHKLYDSLMMRALIIQINVALILFSYLFSSAKYFKKVTKPADFLVKIMLILIPLFSVSILSLLAIGEVELYFILIISSHLIQSLAWAMALSVILMLDLTEMHYKDSITDKLTGLYNRHYFESKVVKNMAKAPTTRYAMMICDIDDFKAINDNYGHHAGDLVIQKVAFCIEKVMGKGYLLCRFGGEEFMIFGAPNELVYNEDIIVKQANTLLDMIRRSPVLIDDKVIYFTVSLGLVYFEPNEDCVENNTCLNYTQCYERSFKRADNALYVAKDLGKDRVCIG